MLHIIYGPASLWKKFEQFQLLNNSAIHQRSPRGLKRNTQMLAMVHTDGDGSVEIELGPFATRKAKVSKRLKCRTKDEYHQHAIVQLD